MLVRALGPSVRAPGLKVLRVLHVLAAAVLVINLIVVVVWPLLVGRWLGAALDPVYTIICHRLPDRSFTWGGAPMLVCVRCLGMFVGLAGTALAAVARGPRALPWWVWLAAFALTAAMYADWLLGYWTGVSTVSQRLVTGFLGGAGYYLLATLVVQASMSGLRRLAGCGDAPDGDRDEA